MHYQATARNVSNTTLAAALAVAAATVDPSVPVDKNGLTFASIVGSTIGFFTADVAIAYTGALTPSVVADLTNLWTQELSKAVNTPITPLPVAVT